LYLALRGLRRAEIPGLRWSDIDFDAGTITIARNRVQAGVGNVGENEPKTLSSRRTLPLYDGLTACSDAHRHATPENGWLSARHTSTAGRSR
jgi:integrase